MSNFNRPRVFLGVHEICGYYRNLKDGFDQIEVISSFIDLSEHPFIYPSDKTGTHSKFINLLIHFIRHSSKVRSSLNKKNLFLLIIYIPLEILCRFSILIWAIINFDIFIFGFTTSLLWLTELPLLKLFRKRIIFVFHGSDTRPAYLSGLYFSDNLVKSAEYCIRKARSQKKSIRWIECFAEIIINHPPCAHFHTRKFISWLNIGIPFEPPREFISISNKPTTENWENSESVKIIHAPSRPEQKGTKHIRLIIDKLIHEGYKIDFIELIGKKNIEVLKELTNCDFVIDELYSDTPMASFATEAAYFSKPSIVGSYATDTDFGVIDSVIPPSEFTHPEIIEQSIRKLITMRDYRNELGENAKKFVVNHWSPNKVAKRFSLLFKGETPDSWFIEPKSIKYLHGWGLPENKSISLISSVVNLGGEQALQLNDKPILKNKILSFARINTK